MEACKFYYIKDLCKVKATKSVTEHKVELIRISPNSLHL